MATGESQEREALFLARFGIWNMCVQTELSLLYLADFLPGFFSRTNSLCLEDFLCYRKSLRTYGNKFFLSVLKLTNLGEFLRCWS
jgi:hypothetical protein